MLGLFYSLAFHMRKCLGTWPNSWGEEDFPRLLIIHHQVAGNVFAILLLSCIIFVPPLIYVFSVVRRWRRFVPYLALHAVLFLACWGLMQFAPKPFLYWWSHS